MLNLGMTLVLMNAGSRIDPVMVNAEWGSEVGDEE
jgi:hypothetical protein